MKKSDRQKIAALFPGRWDRNYVASKLRTDPLYDAVGKAIADSTLPLLDLGCGLGLTAFTLRCAGSEVPILGLDYDIRKINAAVRAACGFRESNTKFIHHDLREGLPEHAGNVCILDILQFFSPEQLESVVKLACDRVAPGGKLVIRSGLRDSSLRFKITVLGDLLAKATSWMKAAPTHYPTATDFEQILSPFGTVSITPLWGGTPFNNHLIVMKKAHRLDAEIA